MAKSTSDREKTKAAKQPSDQTIKIDGRDYNLSSLSSSARALINQINFCNAEIQQLQNEWAVCDTARMGYTAALKQDAATQK